MKSSATATIIRVPPVFYLLWPALAASAALAPGDSSAGVSTVGSLSLSISLKHIRFHAAITNYPRYSKILMNIGGGMVGCPASSCRLPGPLPPQLGPSRCRLDELVQALRTGLGGQPPIRHSNGNTGVQMAESSSLPSRRLGWTYPGAYTHTVVAHLYT